MAGRCSPRGEPPFEVNPADHDVGRRAAQAARDGVGRVVIGLSSPLGIEYLAPEDAKPLLDAYHDGVTELGAPFAGWAAACLTAIDAPGLAKQLDRGFVGLQLPATAVADESGYRWCSPLLDVLAERDLPLVHPPWARGGSDGGRPGMVGRPRPLCSATARGMVRVPRLRPAGLPTAAGLLHCAGRSRAVAWRAPGRPRRSRPAGAWCGRSAACSLKHPATATVLSTPYSACSASTCSYLARIGRMRSRIPVLALATQPAMRSA